MMKMMRLENIPFWKSLPVLFRTIKYVYGKSPWMALVRDLSFVVVTALEMTLIKLGGLFIDGAIELLETWEVFSIREFFYTEAFQMLSLMLAGWIAIKGLNSLMAYLRDKMWRIVKVDAEFKILEKLESENLEEIEQSEFQDLITFVPGYSIQRIFDTYTVFSDVIRHSLRLVTSLILLATSMGPSVFFLILISLAEPIAQYLGDKKIKNYRLNEVEDIKFIEYLWGQAVWIPNFAELKVDGIMKYISKAHNRGSREFNEGIVELNKHYHIDSVFWAMVGQILMRGYQVYVLAFSITQRLSLGDFKVLFDYAGSGYGASYNAVRSGTKIFDHLSYVEKFFELLDYEGFGDLRPGDKSLPKRGTPKLQLLNLDFAYPEDGKKVLENVNIEIKPGEKVALIGGDGSGKSTIVKTLCGLYQVVAGDYQIGEYSVKELARGELKGKTSVVFQDFVRYSMSLRRNITMSGERVALNRSLYEKVKEVSGVKRFMKEEGLKDSQLLGKYFTGGKEISPGYWQRLAIARMLYRDREINMMDEAFTYIDGPSRARILDNILEFLGDEKTLIYVAQDTDHLKKFDTIYFLKGGKVVESGNYKELMDKKGAFYKEVKYNG